MDRLLALNYIKDNENYLFPNDKYDENYLANLLEQSNVDINALYSLKLKNPKNHTLISFFVGSLGVDRLIEKNYIMAVVKYFTLGGVGILWLIDILNAKKRCRAYNCKQIEKLVGNPELLNKKVEQQQNAQNVAHNVMNAVKDPDVQRQMKGVAKNLKQVNDSFYVNK